MPTATAQQVSFNGGELAPRLYGRTDLEKYDSCVKTMKNFIPTLQGDIVNRPGTKFVVEVKDSTKNVRLIPFQFSVTQAYVIELGDLYMRVIADGGQVVYPVGHPDAGNPVEVVTPFAHTDLDRIQFAQSADVLFLVHPNYAPQKISRYSNTEWTCDSISFGTSAATPINLVSDAPGTDYYYIVTSVVGAEESVSSTPAGSSNETSTLSWDAVFEAEYYNLYKLKNGAHNWIGEADGTSFTDSTIEGDPGKRAPEAYNPFSAEPALESLGPNLVPVMTQDGNVYSAAGGGWTATTASASVVPLSGASSLYAMFDGTSAYVSIYDQVQGTGDSTIVITPDAGVAVGGYSITNATDTAGAPKSFTLEGYDGSWHMLDERANETTWGAGEKRTFTFYNETAYTQYRIVFRDAVNNILVSIVELELYTATYSDAANYPGSVTLYQQRLILARTDANPQTFWGSQTGNFFNFNTSRPLQDDDSYQFTIYSNQINEIKWIAAMKSLLTGTSGSEWEITAGSGGGSITPTSVNVVSQGNRGSEAIVPVIIGSSLLFVARGGKSIRDYGFNFDVDGYTGDDLTLLASHLFEDSSVRAWAFQRAPYSVVWVVLEDGSLIGLTYDKDQKVIAWHQHETDGNFESVAVIYGS